MNISEGTCGLVTSIDQLERLYERPNWAARAKETDRIIPAYRSLIEASPYMTLATAGPHGVDCSPRGDAPGFVRVQDERTLLIPDRAGNNRIESLRNILHNPEVALHFLIPGCGETLRIKGRAIISTAPNLLKSFASTGKTPRTVVIVSVSSVYFHCAKAITRSRLWDVSQHIRRDQLPSVNTMLAAIQARRYLGAFERFIRPSTPATLESSNNEEAVADHIPEPQAD